MQAPTNWRMSARCLPLVTHMKLGVPLHGTEVAPVGHLERQAHERELEVVEVPEDVVRRGKAPLAIERRVDVRATREQ